MDALVSSWPVVVMQIVKIPNHLSSRPALNALSVARVNLMKKRLAKVKYFTAVLIIQSVKMLSGQSRSVSVQLAKE